MSCVHSKYQLKPAISACCSLCLIVFRCYFPRGKSTTIKAVQATYFTEARAKKRQNIQFKSGTNKGERTTQSHKHVHTQNVCVCVVSEEHSESIMKQAIGSDSSLPTACHSNRGHTHTHTHTHIYSTYNGIYMEP